MGTSTFANYTVLPEIAVAKIRKDAPFEKVCLLGCGVTTGIGAVLNHRQGANPATPSSSSASAASACRRSRARVWRAPTIIGVDINPDKCALAEQLG